MVVVLGVQAVLLESSPGYHGEAGWAGLDHHGGCVLDPRGQSRCPFLHAQMWDRNKHDYGVVSLCVRMCMYICVCVWLFVLYRYIYSHCEMVMCVCVCQHVRFMYIWV